MPVAAVSGRKPVAATARTTRAPTPVPPVVSSSGCTASSPASSLRMKYAASPTAAPSPQSTPIGLRVSPSRRSSTKTSPTRAMRRPDQDRVRRATPVAHPVVADQQHRREVLQQQGHPDREVLDGAEEAELGHGDRGDAVPDDPGRTGGAWAGGSAAAGPGRGRAGPGRRRPSGPRPPRSATSRGRAASGPGTRTARTPRPRSERRADPSLFLLSGPKVDYTHDAIGFGVRSQRAFHS